MAGGSRLERKENGVGKTQLLVWASVVGLLTSALVPELGYGQTVAGSGGEAASGRRRS